MHFEAQLILFCCSTLLVSEVACRKTFPSLDALRPMVSDGDQESAVRDLVSRIIPEHAVQLEIVVNRSISSAENDLVQVGPSSKADKAVRVAGNTGVAAAFGVGQYLRNYTLSHFSWDAFQTMNVPTSLPKPNSTTEQRSISRYRYFANVCTFSYSMLWWNWNRWQRHIDWMALNGINLPLALTGNEATLRMTFQKFGLNDSEIDTFFTGPPFLAWSRMGNFKHWLSPLSAYWYKRSLDLQSSIIERELSLGMVPVFPGFVGRVPDAFLRRYPGRKTTTLAWQFNATYSSINLLDPTDDMFANLTHIYMSIVNKRFKNRIKAFSVDLYNEMHLSSYAPDVIAPKMEALFATINDSVPDSVWVMQAWLFVNDQSWLTRPGALSGLLNSVPEGRLLMLDLFSETTPMYSKTQSYLGQPFIWNMLHNFGGTSGMYGNKDSVNQGIDEGWSLPGSTMVGTGLTMEGMFQNYVMYQLVLDRSWTTSKLDLDNWQRNYVQQRYGMDKVESSLSSAWHGLWDTIYDSYHHSGEIVDVLIKRPSFTNKPKMQMKRTAGIVQAGKDLLKFINETDIHEMNRNYMFTLDSVDITRQVLYEYATVLYLKMKKAHWLIMHRKFKNASDQFLMVMDHLDDLLSSHRAFRLSDWLDQAKVASGGANETAEYYFGFKNQLTVWGPPEAKLSEYSILDYAAKHWAGLVKNYYRPRWALFQKQVMAAGWFFNQRKFNEDCERDVELVFQATNYPMPKNMMPLQKVVKLLTYYLPKFDSFFKTRR